MSSDKKVRFQIPENKIKFIDYLYRKKIILPYIPEMRLIQLKRFQENQFYDWIVYSNDGDKSITLEESLISQGVQAGDILEVISSRKSRINEAHLSSSGILRVF